MKRTVFDEDHETFRKTIREFITREVTPSYAEWERDGMVPRTLYRRLGELGVFGIEIPEQYGGAGETSFKYQAVIRLQAEIDKGRASGISDKSVDEIFAEARKKAIAALKARDAAA